MKLSNDLFFMVQNAPLNNSKGKNRAPATLELINYSILKQIIQFLDTTQVTYFCNVQRIGRRGGQSCTGRPY